MEVYFYSEYNGCVNSGKVFRFGDCTELISLYGNGLTAVGAFGEEGNFADSAICLGDFDGVHRGHRALFDAAKKYKRRGVLLFDRNIKGNCLLTTLPEKLKLIEESGMDYAVIAEFDKRFSERSPEAFADFLKDTLNVGAAIVGYDYHFGKNAMGDSKKLEELCAERDIKTEIVGQVSIGGEAVKSTHIRTLIGQGNMEAANRLLGYDYTVLGTVEKGLRNGTQMGFPTANIQCADCDKLLPPDGVYRGKCEGFDAVVNIGKNPTFGAEERTVEVHIIGYSGDLYGKMIAVELSEKIRDDIKFDSAEELAFQIQSDVDYVIRTTKNKQKGT